MADQVRRKNALSLAQLPPGVTVGLQGCRGQRRSIPNGHGRMRWQTPKLAERGTAFRRGAPQFRAGGC